MSPNASYSFVKVEVRSEEIIRLCKADMVQFSQIQVRKSKEEREFTFFQNMPCSLLLSHVDKILHCIHPWWISDDNMYHWLDELRLSLSSNHGMGESGIDLAQYANSKAQIKS